MGQETLTLMMKLSLVVFMAGNLLDMGIRLKPGTALLGVSNRRFVLLTLFWGFVAGPALAYGITQVLALAPAHAAGLMLVSMAPCAPFLPMIVGKAGGDLGYTAAFTLLTAAAMVVYMPLAVPLLVPGLSVGAWVIARPLLLMIVLPLALGMTLRRQAPAIALMLQPWVKRVTGVATLVVAVLCVRLYGESLLGTGGSFAFAAQLILLSVLAAAPYCLGFGLPHEQKIVLSVGGATRNIGAALAPLFSLPIADEGATVMVVLAFPVMVVAGVIAGAALGRHAVIKS